MHVLMLGGTRFLGRHVVEATLARGHEVTLFNRGKTGADLFPRRLARLLDRLKSVPDGGGTLLDNTMLVYGSGLGDGNRHNHEDLPILLAGRGGGTLNPGRHVRYPRETPLANLYLSLLDRMNVRETSFADSTGRLGGI